MISNWCDEKALCAERPTKGIFPKNDPRLKILFAGNMGKAQALDSVLETAKVLQLDKANVVFIMIGGGLEVEGLKKRANESALNNVLFIPQVPMGEIGAYLRQADVLLVHLKKDPLFSVTIPSKTQAYMSIGKPILMGVEGDAADIIKRANAGVVFEPQNVDALVQAVYQLINKSKDEIEIMGVNAQRYYRDNLSLKSGVDAFARIFYELT